MMEHITPPKLNDSNEDFSKAADSDPAFSALAGIIKNSKIPKVEEENALTRFKEALKLFFNKNLPEGIKPRRAFLDSMSEKGKTILLEDINSKRSPHEQGYALQRAAIYSEVIADLYRQLKKN